jgi:energy-coupling factor transporter ATP-binding protein EcfA2
MRLVDTERLRTAAARFVAFFRELAEVFVERDDLLTQIALSLICREHMLLTGSTGAGKSTLIHAVLSRIRCPKSGTFARQFTQSTVQTDLAGAVDVKALMETGRIDPLFDETLQGVIYELLDELFDGRDLLLRSTLHLLHERQLQQTTKTMAGQVECALLSSDRYPAEILDSSPETSLGLVDRIAFLGFVPRRFADGDALRSVLRSRVGVSGPLALHYQLTIQDLEAIRQATEDIAVSDTLCERLAAFVVDFESEMGVARRADPSFVPSRRPSTRSTVRLGRLLRAACFYDWAFGGHQRALATGQRDFELLRFGMILSGPSPQQVATLLQTETDATERRQLSIMRTERQVFDRCLGRLPPAIPSTPPPRVSEGLLAASASNALAARSSAELLELARELAQAASTRREGAFEAATRLETTVQELSLRAFQRGLSPGSGQDTSIEPAIEELAQLADDIERTSTSHRPVARWLRVQSLHLVQRAMELSPTALGEGLDSLMSLPSGPSEVLARAERRLARPRRLAALRERLRSQGVDEPDAEQNEERWKAALDRVFEEVVSIWDDGLRVIGPKRLQKDTERGPESALTALEMPLRLMQQCARSLDELGRRGAELIPRVLRPRVAPYVQAEFESLEAVDRGQVAQEVARILTALSDVGLGGSVSRSHLAAWSAQALLRAEPDEPDQQPITADYEGYRAFRARLPRSSLALTLADICLRIAPELADALQDPSQGVGASVELLRSLPKATRDELARRDLNRIRQSVELLENWFEALSVKLPNKPDEAMRALAESQFFRVTRDESALARVALEAQLVARVFEGTDVTALLERIGSLDTRSTALLHATIAARSDEAWKGEFSSTAEPE